MRRVLICTVALLAAACAVTPTPSPGPERIASPQAAIPDVPLCEPAPALFGAGAGLDTAAFDRLDIAGRRTALLTLPDCLENPDPALRDGYAFELLSLILRGEGQSSETLRSLKTDLLGRLATAGKDKNGFRGPFAALALAEVARTDRITPWMTGAERSELIAAAHIYLGALTDYRGFSDTEGWRHGVAHSADLLMQLSLNPALTKPQAEAILAAVALKAGTTDHAYVFGESDRLAAPVIYLARKNVFTDAEWTAWFTGLWPAEDPLRAKAYKSEAALARLHNLRAFSEAVYVSADVSGDAVYKPVADAARLLLASLP